MVPSSSNPLLETVIYVETLELSKAHPFSSKYLHINCALLSLKWVALTGALPFVPMITFCQSAIMTSKTIPRVYQVSPPRLGNESAPPTVSRLSDAAAFSLLTVGGRDAARWR
jgi:hypothetical protein